MITLPTHLAHGQGIASSAKALLLGIKPMHPHVEQAERSLALVKWHTSAIREVIGGSAHIGLVSTDNIAAARPSLIKHADAARDATHQLQTAADDIERSIMHRHPELDRIATWKEESLSHALLDHLGVSSKAHRNNEKMTRAMRFAPEPVLELRGAASGIRAEGRLYGDGSFFYVLPTHQHLARAEHAIVGVRRLANHIGG